MNQHKQRAFSGSRRLIWCALIALVGAAATVVRVPTTLGIKVPEANIPGINPDLIDTSSREYIWRVWWRGRDDLVTFDPQWIVTTGLLVLLAIFAGGLILAIWLALGPDQHAELPGE